ncbi:MAG TPA: response regulator transcription factor [Vicinamibacterales bacterium]|nr:response regulator transcription factor [Vicinamibacterales bacterium]
MTGRPVRVILADDHTLVRSGIRRILDAEPGLEVVAEAADGDAALDLVRHAGADVLVLDLKMPGTDGIDVLRAAKAIQPALKVIILTMHAGQEYVARAVKAGADAYLLKDSAVQDLVAAVDEVAAGRSYFSPAVQRQMAGLLRGSEAPARSQSLTEREREVLTWLARGLSSREVARELDISVRTVETHRANLMHKLGVKSVAVLIQVAIREGMIEPPSTP